MIMYKYMHLIYNMHHETTTFKIEAEQDISIYENLFVFINMYIFAYVNIYISALYTIYELQFFLFLFLFFMLFFRF
jgi:hypothetical protein